MNYNEVLQYEPFSLAKEEKSKIVSNRINYLTKFHYDNCKSYRKILDFLGYDYNKNYNVEESVFIPVRLFKELEFLSVPSNEIIKTMFSSGTTSQKQSKIFLDKETSSNQQKTLLKIMGDFLPQSRLPMIIIDSERVVKDINFFSARKAGIIGYSLFAKDKIYALDYEMNLEFEKLEEFLLKHKDKSIFAFGYTFIIWQYFYEELKKRNKKLDLSNVILLHGGGWKKLNYLNITQKQFNNSIYEMLSIKKIHQFYGMAEQTGSIYTTCEYNHMHTSTYSDIIIRRKEDFSLCDIGEKGLIQLISLIPQSYAGHNILTEDEGVMLGEDDCPCGRKGKYFKILGRIKNAEIRGCSDTYERK